MSYLVLARKWRPRSFETLVGQDHVVRALTNALNTQRLHHAWLFTGTRGVGKTTLSRILAKSLNCETGITSKPCGVCRACVEIDEGRFVDYLEFDAASNRRVEEMTQLLEQAVYAPSSGRYKIYMIDEVHMLSGHAFNAMLKTLEEPPPHIKFILATTDPQKMPVTVLSRCLQFNLKQMPPDAIVSHLNHVLTEEEVAFEVPGLRQIAQAAGGSMRDALSLTDQAIAFSGSNITGDAVRDMLGTIDQRFLVRLLDSLNQGSAQGVLDIANELYERGYSFGGALADLAVLLSQIAIEQRLPGTALTEALLQDDIVRLARTCHPDTLQLFYSIAIHGRNELALSPDEYAGFVMTCLRMLSLVTSEPAHSTASEWQAGNGHASGGQKTAAVVTAAGPAPAHHEAVAVSPAPAAAEQGAQQAPATMGQPVTASATDLQKKNLNNMPIAAAAQPPEAESQPSAALPAQAQPANLAPIAPVAPETAEQVVASDISTRTTISSDGALPVVLAPQREPIVVPPVQAAEQRVQERPAWEEDTATGAVGTASAPVADMPDSAVAAVAPAPNGTAAQPFVNGNGADHALPASDAGQTRVSNSPDAQQITEESGPPVWEDIPPDWDAAGLAGQTDDDGDIVPADNVVVEKDQTWVPSHQDPQARRPLSAMNAREWVQLVAELPLAGYAAEMARRCEWVAHKQNKITLRIPVKGQNDLNAKIKLETALTEYFHEVIRVDMVFGRTGDDTLHAVEQAEREALQKRVEKAVQEDEFINTLIADLGARVVPGSIEPFRQKSV
ncbi:MAG: DNA polymerase III subunit gamma/tau [Advenella sp.]|uniref:DNA polymerase III subunit gamma/tau n=1 Tax=Advenella kashmirensis TaxID=310575 RepID=A0A356LDI5_9BURK|nr:DNA polymerase III subunit gamma/tau [Advenella kashmirensis]